MPLLLFFRVLWAFIPFRTPTDQIIPSDYFQMSFWTKNKKVPLIRSYLKKRLILLVEDCLPFAKQCYRLVLLFSMVSKQVDSGENHQYSPRHSIGQRATSGFAGSFWTRRRTSGPEH